MFSDSNVGSSWLVTYKCDTAQYVRTVTWQVTCTVAGSSNEMIEIADNIK